MAIGERAKRIIKIEALMASGDFWLDKNKAQELVREYNELRKGGDEANFDGGDAIKTIFSGAGGDDAEDFTGMLLEMYRKFFARKGWSASSPHSPVHQRHLFRCVQHHCLHRPA